MQTIFKRGIPTGPDIEAIRREYPDAALMPGDLIPYADIERLINCRQGSSRFVTVTNQWRRIIERDSNLVIECERNTGFKVLAESGKLSFARNKMRAGMRAVRRSVTVAARIDRAQLTGDEQGKLDALERRQTAIAEVAQLKTNPQLPSLTD